MHRWRHLTELRAECLHHVIERVARDRREAKLDEIPPAVLAVYRRDLFAWLRDTAHGVWVDLEGALEDRHIFAGGEVPDKWVGFRRASASPFRDCPSEGFAVPHPVHASVPPPPMPLQPEQPTLQEALPPSINAQTYAAAPQSEPIDYTIDAVTDASSEAALPTTLPPSLVLVATVTSIVSSRDDGILLTELASLLYASHPDARQLIQASGGCKKWLQRALDATQFQIFQPYPEKNPIMWLAKKRATTTNTGHYVPPAVRVSNLAAAPSAQTEQHAAGQMASQVRPHLSTPQDVECRMDV
ncbi:hypothetical protein OAO87_01020 [bacterium]|nr:hypothetical protein [bacterium]